MIFECQYEKDFILHNINRFRYLNISYFKKERYHRREQQGILYGEDKSKKNTPEGAF